jgi:hypothetical protein
MCAPFLTGYCLATAKLLQVTNLFTSGATDCLALTVTSDPAGAQYYPVSMPQQLPQIAILPTRYPDPRKVIFQH